MTDHSTDALIRGRSRNLLLALMAAVLLTICLVFTFVMAGWYRDVGRGLGASGQSVAAAVAHEIDRNIELLDFSLRSVADQWRNPDIQALAPHLRDLVLFDGAMQAPGFGAMFVLDREGAVVANSSKQDQLNRQYGDRDYFRVHVATANLGLFVSRPFPSRATGRWVVAFSRRIDGPDGAFGGVAVVTLDLDYLAKLYSGLKIGPDSAVTLFRIDGTVITREPPVRADLRLWAGANDAFTRMRVSHDGTFEGESPVDGQHRIISYHRVGTLPLIQAVEVGGDGDYADWWRRAAVVAGLLVLLCVGIMALSLALYRELGRRNVAEAQLSRLAATDALTGLANRRRFEAVLTREWSRASVSGQPIALLMADADAFKVYNDVFGHLAGDGALQAIAGRLEAGAESQGGLACRCGGEEFVVMLPGLDESAALAIAEEMRSAVQALALPHPRGIDDVLTISVGVASGRPGDGASSREVLAVADAALYRAKRDGRNRCCGPASVERQAA